MPEENTPQEPTRANVINMFTKELNQNEESWAKFLDTAARMYERSFIDQAAIYKQRPKAKFCASREVWEKEYGRAVKEGIRGIAVINEETSTDQVVKAKYVFYISQTEAKAGEIDAFPSVWKLEREHEASVSGALKSAYGQYNLPQGDLKTQILEVSKALAKDSAMRPNIKNKSMQESWTQLMASSVGYVVLSRCGMDAGGLIKNFRDIEYVNTPTAVNALGTATQKLAREVLSYVEKSVTQYEAERTRENLNVQDRETPPQEMVSEKALYLVGDNVYLETGLEYQIQKIGRQEIVLQHTSEDGHSTFHILDKEIFERQFRENLFNQSLIAERQAVGQKENETALPQENQAAAENNHELEAPAFTKKWEHSEEDVLSVLRQISDDDEKHLLTFELLRNGDTEHIQTNTVKRVLGKGKNDIVYPDGARGTELHDESGMRITKEDPDGRPVAVTFLPWNEVAAEIVHLIGGEGRYAAEETEITRDAEHRYRAGELLSKWEREELARGKLGKPQSLESELQAAIPPQTQRDGEINIPESENAQEQEREELVRVREEEAPQKLVEETVQPVSSDISGSTKFPARGEIVQLPPVYTDGGEYNRAGRLISVEAVEPIDGHQVFVGAEDGDRADFYVMTDSGRIVQCGRFTPEDAQKNIQRLFEEASWRVEDALNTAHSRVDYNLAAAADRLKEADEHNDLVEQAVRQRQKKEADAQIVLLPKVFEDGQYNRDGKRSRVTPSDPIGKYQIYTGKAFNDWEHTVYVMTDSGRLAALGSWSKSNWDNLTEGNIDRSFAKARNVVEESLKSPEQWVDYQAAAIANRLQEADEHNAPVRELRQREHEEEAERHEAAREAEFKKREEVLKNTVDEMANALVRGERVKIPRGQFEKNPMLELFSLYEVNVPLRTKGWITQRLEAFQMRQDSGQGMMKINAWGDAKSMTPAFKEAMAELYDVIKLRSPERQREFMNMSLADIFKQDKTYARETVYLQTILPSVGDGPLDERTLPMTPEEALNNAGEHISYVNAAAANRLQEAEDHNTEVSSIAEEANPASHQVLPYQRNTEARAETVTAAANFRITDDHLEKGGQKEKYRRNVEAIRTLQKIEDARLSGEERQATPEEQETLSRYVGWGGISQAFDAEHKDWGKEYKELKELLTEDEYKSARASTLNAHYTSPTVIKAIYETVVRMGFKVGNVLEPSMGVGNFFGLQPESMENSKLYGVELDSITGHIAKQLYPKADISVTGFEKTTWPDNFFDLAVGNVPFGQYKVLDKKYDRHNFLIHDYFLAKSLDQVRPGGVMAFVTSKGTMDKANPEVRKYLAERAELLGAVRLPNDAFKANAGTEVTTDILFLQKRERPIAVEPDWVHLDKTEDGVPVNRYFAANPHMILGKMVREKSLYGNDNETACIPAEGANLAEQLRDALSHINGQITEWDRTDIQEAEKKRESIPADPSVRNFSYTLHNGELYYRENSVMYKPDLSKGDIERASALVELRDCARNLIHAQLESDEYEIRREQQRLNELYDVFVPCHGRLNDKRNAKVFDEDSSYYLLCSLEDFDENGSFKSKADMFSKRTIRPHSVPDSVNTPGEALMVSIAEKAEVDLDYMASLLAGKTPEDVAAELKGVIFPNPELTDEEGKPRYETANEYLSGNVRRKLAAAKQHAETQPELYSENVAALELAQPKDLEAHEIEVRLGAPWVGPEYVKQFMFELLETSASIQQFMDVHYSPQRAVWGVEGKRQDWHNVKVNTTYGTGRMSAYDIIENTLNSKEVKVYDRGEDGKSYVNQKETALAQQKQESIKQAFKDWIFKAPERRHDLVKTYNERFNSTRSREYDGRHIAFSGMNPEINLREHQSNAIARILYGGNTLLAHEVGAGKSFEMVASAMESKRLGLAQKSLFVVPNHLIEQMATDFMKLYPAANILVAKEKDFTAKNRKTFCSRIATGDYDAIVIGHSQFERIPLSQERQKKFLDNQIDEIMEALEEAKRVKKGGRFTVKQLEKTKQNLEVKLEKLMAAGRKDDVITFEELGVDRLYVDEAHGFKNLYLRTQMSNVAGIPQTEAQKSSDLYSKCQYMDEITGNKGVIFATGTPVSNSMTELYTMMRYLQQGKLDEMGLGQFDAWASTFGETVTGIELSPEGTGYRAKTRFAKFHNLPELMNTFKEVADIKMASELDLPRPKANYQTIAVKPTEDQKELMTTLSIRAADVHNRKVKPDKDNMLKITSDGRKIGLDQRLIDPFLPDDPGSKVNACMNNVHKIWEETKNDRLTQLVFVDFSTPDKNKFNVYDDIKTKLIKKGVPEKEIAFIHNADTKEKKEALFKKVRSGQVRILLGSTAKMGSGTNVQDKLIAIHNVDCPWRPADLEQRAGRIVRQGNKNPEVSIFSYVTENTFDAYLYQTVENKQKFISQIMTSKNPVRNCEDVDDSVLSYSEVKALCIGDSRIKEKMDLDIQVAKLRMLEGSYKSQQYRMQDDVLRELPKQIKRAEQDIVELEKDVDRVNSHSGEKFNMTVSGKAYGEDDKRDAGAVLLETYKGAQNAPIGLVAIKIGEYKGFEMTVTRLDLQLKSEDGAIHSVDFGESAAGTITRIDNALSRIPEKLEDAKENLEGLRKELEDTRQELDKPFQQAQELAEKSARLTELDILLNMDLTSEIAGLSAELQERVMLLDKKTYSTQQEFVSDRLTLFEDVLKSRGCQVSIEHGEQPSTDQSLNVSKDGGQYRIQFTDPTDSGEGELNFRLEDTASQNIKALVAFLNEKERELLAQENDGIDNIPDADISDSTENDSGSVNSTVPSSVSEAGREKAIAEATAPENPIASQKSKAGISPHQKQWVTFCANEKDLRLTGKVLSIDEEKGITMLACRGKKIPCYVDKGYFEPAEVKLNYLRPENSKFQFMER